MTRGLVPVAAACAAGAAVVIGLSPVERMPQLAFGGDALSVAFGGAKSAISDSMFRKADSYFHGGVDMECTQHGHHHHDHGDLDGNAHDDGHDHHHDEAGGGHDSEEQDVGESHMDPWAWINEHIRAPEVERHLEGEKAVELMPWFWAAVKANPHNTEAWLTAIYMADKSLKNEKLAAGILADAKKANPESIAIALAEGRFLYQGGRGDLPAAEVAFNNARALGLRAIGGRQNGISGRDAEDFLAILDYLSHFAAKRGDRKSLAVFLREAKTIDGASIITKNIERRISALELKGEIR